MYGTTSTSTNTNTGTITFSIIGGIGPYTYTITSVNDLNGVPFNITPIVGTIATSNTNVTIGGLVAGTYNISVVDAIGTPVSDLVTVNGPTPFYCIAYVSSGATSGATGIQNGAITISEVGGGTSPYQYVVKTGAGAVVSGPATWTSSTSISLPISGPIGYVVDVYDSATPPHHCIKSGLTITGPSAISVSANITNEHCWNSQTGSMAINISGGQLPYEIKVTDSRGFEVNNQENITELTATANLTEGNGPFNITVVDDLGVTVNLTTGDVGFDIGEMLVLPSPDVGFQCDPNNYQIPFFISSANFAPVVVGQPVYVQYAIDADYANNNWTNASPILYPVQTVPMYLTIPATTILGGWPSFTPTSTINSRIAIRYMSGPTYPAPTCYSEEIVYEAEQLKLPPVRLEITGDTVNNTTIPPIPAAFNNAIQPSPTTGQYTFDTTYNLLNFNRLPYRLQYTVNGGAIQTTNPIYDMPYTLYIPNVSGTVNLTLTIVDSKGCVSPTISRTINLPASVLQAQAITTIQSMGNSTTPTVYRHKITATGGIPPYHFGTPTGPVIPMPAGYFYNDGAAIVIGTPVYDSVGNAVIIVNI